MSKLIAVDIGHGNNTYPPSKGVPGMAEFSFNNAVGKYAKPMLERNGFRVLYTQPPDSADVGLNRRSTLANQRGADLFLSIHADWNDNSSARGAWSFYWNTSTNGKRMAEIWLDQLTSVTDIRKRRTVPSKRGEWTNFHVLRETRMPAVLMEHGFMSNSQDLKMLKSDSYRKKAAEALTRSVCQFYGATYQGEKTTTQGGSSVFKDVSENHTLYKEIKEAEEQGIAKGYTDGTFKPDEPITRAEAVALVMRAKNS